MEGTFEWERAFPDPEITLAQIKLLLRLEATLGIKQDLS